MKCDGSRGETRFRLSAKRTVYFNRRERQFSRSLAAEECASAVVELVRNVMAHAQKPGLVFQRNGRVHLNRRGFQFSRLLAADACASAVVMVDRPSSDTVQDCWLPTPFAYFPFTSPPVRHRVPSDSERAIMLDTPCSEVV